MPARFSLRRKVEPVWMKDYVTHKQYSSTTVNAASTVLLNCPIDSIKYFFYIIIHPYLSMPVLLAIKLLYLNPSPINRQ